MSNPASMARQTWITVSMSLFRSAYLSDMITGQTGRIQTTSLEIGTQLLGSRYVHNRPSLVHKAMPLKPEATVS